jgi:MoaA/NifB/PqqE/SkfB family radical SAM enzyme
LDESPAGAYFIDRYISHAIPSCFEIKVVPSYRCNLACGYCYAARFRHRYPEEMCWDVFAGIVERFLREDGRVVRFLGGEPALWEHANPAIEYLRARALRSIVLSNGTVALDVLPDEVHINIEHYYEGPLREQILATLGSYRDRGALVRFRYNVQPNDSDAKLDEVLDLAARHRVPSLHLGTAWPHERTRAFGAKVLAAVRRCRARGFGCTLGDPIPFCMFAPHERAELAETANLSGRCMCGHIPLVNPDGVTLFPCQAVPIARPDSDLAECGRDGPAYRNVVRAFAHDVGRAVRAIDESCLTCGEYLRGACQNGCLGNRFVAHGDTHLDASETVRVAVAGTRPTVRELSRGDEVDLRFDGGRAVRGALLGLPGERLAFLPGGGVYIQNGRRPQGAEMLTGAMAIAGRAGPIALTEREVLVVPRDGGEPVVAALASCAPVGAGSRIAMRDLGVPRVEVESLACEVNAAGRVLAAFTLDAEAGAIVEVTCADGRSHRKVGTALAVQPVGGVVAHRIELANGTGRRRPGPHALAVHCGGITLAKVVIELAGGACRPGDDPRRPDRPVSDLDRVPRGKAADR